MIANYAIIISPGALSTMQHDQEPTSIPPTPIPVDLPQPPRADKPEYYQSPGQKIGDFLLGSFGTAGLSIATFFAAEILSPWIFWAWAILIIAGIAYAMSQHRRYLLFGILPGVVTPIIIAFLMYG